VAVPVGAMLPVEGRQVELVDHVEDEPGQVASGQPVAQIGRQQERLVAVAAQEVVRHALLYSSLRSLPMRLFLTRQLPHHNRPSSLVAVEFAAHGRT
jgi:hypothetical protein